MRKTEKMTKLKSNQKGITLIALVITIIVLLILAGVAISMLSGENGILRQAAKAKEQTEKKSTLEQVQLAAMDALMRGSDLTSIENETNLSDALTSQGLNEAEVDGEAATGYTVTVKDKTYKVASDGTVVEKSIVDYITATNYGDYIKGYKDLADIEGTDKDWQVFYNDGKNVWIIASDYVQLDATTASKAGMVTNGYYAWWDSVPSNGEKYPNGKCAAELAKSDNWEAYLDKSLATKAMGGPTIEMFSESYNSKYPVTDENNGIIDYQLQTTASNEGYQVRWNKTGTESWTTYIRGVTDTASNGMYLKTGTLDVTLRAYAYWLASPSAVKSSCVMYVRSTGLVDLNATYGTTIVGVRPVVCLKSDILVTSTTTDGITTWTIQK